MSTQNLKEVLEILNKLKQIIDDHGMITTIFAASVATLYYTSPVYMPYLLRLRDRARNQSSVTSTTENQTDDSKIGQEKMKKNIKQVDAMERDTVDNADQGESSQNKKKQKKKEKIGDDIPDKIDYVGDKDTDDSDDDSKKTTYSTTFSGTTKVGILKKGGTLNVNSPININ